MQGHIIVSGEDALAMRIVEELNGAGVRIVRLTSAAELVRAGVGQATAVICAGDDDATNLEIALLARRANPHVRVVARLANSVLREAVADDNGPGAILDVAELTAPSVVEACLQRSTHRFEAAGMQFVISDTVVTTDASLREIYGALAPVAVVNGPNSSRPGTVVDCPGRDQRVHAGDWTAMLGTADELATAGVAIGGPTVGTRTRRPAVRRLLDAARALRHDINPMLYRALGAALTLWLGSSIVLMLGFHRPGTTFLDALYFTTESITTVGYGDFSFLNQPAWLQLWGIMLMFAGVTTTAVLVAFIADLLLSRRFSQSAARRRVNELQKHIIVVGLGSFGIRVVSDLKAAGCDVAVIERDEANRFLSTAAELDVPVIFGDATLRQTLESAGVTNARAVAVLTQDDVVNIEVGIVLREMLGPRVLPKVVRPDVPLVLRVYDRVLGAAVAERFGFENVRSTVELATPWFLGAAMGLQVLSTFSVGQRSFMVGGLKVGPNSELDGQRMFEMSTQTRVFAITRDDAPVQLQPRRDAKLRAGDTAYLVGPYRELLDTLRKGQPVQQSDTDPVSREAKTG